MASKIIITSCKLSYSFKFSNIVKYYYEFRQLWGFWDPNSERNELLGWLFSECMLLCGYMWVRVSLLSRFWGRHSGTGTGTGPTAHRSIVVPGSAAHSRRTNPRVRLSPLLCEREPERVWVPGRRPCCWGAAKCLLRFWATACGWQSTLNRPSRSDWSRAPGHLATQPPLE